METFDECAARLAAEAESFIAAMAPDCVAEVAELFEGRKGENLIADLTAECARLYATIQMGIDRPDLFAARYELESLRDIHAQAESYGALSQVTSHRDHVDRRRNPKLTFEQVHEIRTSDKSDDYLSKKFGVHAMTVYHARCGTSHKSHPTKARPSGPAHKLTPADVKAIQESSELQRVLAKRFGVSQSRISVIKVRARDKTPA